MRPLPTPMPTALVTGATAGCATVEDRCARGLDLLVNNAGIGTRAPFHSVAIEHALVAGTRMIPVPLRTRVTRAVRSRMQTQH
jgi:short-subunit dehydrogenase